MLSPGASPTPEIPTALLTDPPATQLPTDSPATWEPPTRVPTETTIPDVYAPEPLGPAYSKMWFAAGACYDIDVLFTTTTTTCDL
jgi:hypothetical protein